MGVGGGSAGRRREHGSGRRAPRGARSGGRGAGGRRQRWCHARAPTVRRPGPAARPPAAGAWRACPCRPHPLEGLGQLGVAGAGVQQNGGHRLPLALKLQGRALEELVEGRLGGAVRVPAAQPAGERRAKGHVGRRWWAAAAWEARYECQPPSLLWHVLVREEGRGRAGRGRRDSCAGWQGAVAEGARLWGRALQRLAAPSPAPVVGDRADPRRQRRRHRGALAAGKRGWWACGRTSTLVRDVAAKPTAGQPLLPAPQPSSAAAQAAGKLPPRAAPAPHAVAPLALAAAASSGARCFSARMWPAALV